MSLVIEGVNKKFLSKNREANTLKNINFSCKKGEFICVLGASGCGKSTLLNIIAGLETPTSGKVYLNNNEITGVGVDRAVMFQESSLFPWLKVIDNVEFGMKISGVPKAERRRRALQNLKMVNLENISDYYIHELSGGMRQRVELVRALTLDSEILLMDEPFSALDYNIKEILQLELQKVWMETKKTIIFITHNVEEAVLLADKVLVMSGNPGRIKKEFKIELARPRTNEDLKLKYFISKIKNELKEEVTMFEKYCD
ncbi:MAG: ABC transporter ATP-binding protein [Clostridiaceae bacterium]